MSEFFSMGGYGSYIWASYGIAAISLIVLLITTLRGLGQSRTELDQLETVLKSRRPRRVRPKDQTS
ncbi:heme exporter protein CcmD [Thalassospira alkalitolerans]|uniref:Heme exporter protein D n=1 Tax=Thalassospira alkalitolerans TaxID=1293890 RepID=A0A1Y2L8U1_9PROT|nr:heme exporter protein CcmD [Thalassospira alkalitolerans]OSQ44382.1 cytochrome C biogenesis protein CycX [Thalassospira alkalitolerans]|tara:strand:- start:76466 stop:76663 length:198 start_codon:yes stop_codon:yes gene_type:complete